RALPPELEVAYLGDSDTPVRPGLDRVIPAPPIGYAPGLRDRARLFATLVDPRLRRLPVHLFFSPSRTSQGLLAAVRKTAKGRRFVQTVPCSDGAEQHVRALGSLDAVVVTSDHARAKLLGAGLDAAKLVRIHPGVELAPRPAVDPAASRRLLYAGDLDRAVARRLLAVAAMLRRPELAGWTLTIACRPKGEHDALARTLLRTELVDDLGSGRVQLLVEVDDMDELLRSTSLQLYLADHARRKVDLPLVLLEGMARGVGIAVLGAAPVAEIFTLARAEGLDVGLELAPGEDDPHAHALALAAVLVDAGALLRFGRDARRLVERRFSIATMARAYVELYATLA
ncbi:MAG TPA: hypothetical protein VFG69_08005, partial [Nannocystaceae bacterium]|nr:hypothetical protein [Nannocystaceae bacterium]